MADLLIGHQTEWWSILGTFFGPIVVRWTEAVWLSFWFCQIKREECRHKTIQLFTHTTLHTGEFSVTARLVCLGKRSAHFRLNSLFLSFSELSQPLDATGKRLFTVLQKPGWSGTPGLKRQPGIVVTESRAFGSEGFYRSHLYAEDIFLRKYVF